jgi:hypothetical protein
VFIAVIIIVVVIVVVSIVIAVVVVIANYAKSVSQYLKSLNKVRRWLSIR